jgi:predicted enzyme related to lactoylglutathione lyase
MLVDVAPAPRRRIEMPGKVMHFEVHGRDAKRTEQFFGELFDWKVDANNPMQYGLVAAESPGIGGGLCASPAAPLVTFYVAVPDLKAALAKAERLGGKTTMEPHQVPGGPEIAMFTDPDGNQIGLLKDTTV